MPPEDRGWDQSRAGWSEAPVGVGADATTEPPSAFAEGSAPQRYEAGQLVGQGGMGLVRVAEDRVLRRSVARKELSPGHAGDPAATERIVREAWLTAWLDHPGIVAVHDAGVLDDGRPFYTMRLVRGRTLARAMEDGDRLALVRHLQQACDAVASAHAAGIVHRDIKPTNLLIGEHGETQVIDWGLATATPEAVSRWPELQRLVDPHQGHFVGTPGYASPEQSQGENPDPRDDVFSLGVTLRELVGGAERSPELWAIAARAASPTRADRYADASALSAELLRWFEGRRVEAYTYSTKDLLVRVARAWRGPLIVAALGAAALALAITTGWMRTTAQRNRAVAAEHAEQQARRAAERALSLALVEQAVAATAGDARARAEQLAVAALRAVDSPQARGVLAAFAVAPRPRPSEPGLTLRCDWSALAADGSALLCGGADQTVLHELPVGRTLQLPAAASGDVVGAEVRLYGSRYDLTLFSRNTGENLGNFPFVYDKWTPVSAQRRILVGGRPWQPPRYAPPCEGGVRVASVTEDDRKLMQLCPDGTLLLGTPTEPAQTRRHTPFVGETDPQVALWTPAGDAIVVGLLRGELRVLDPDTGQILLSYASELGTIGGLALSAGGLVAVSGSSGGVGIWDIGTGRWLGELPAARQRSLTFVGEDLLVFDGTLRRWTLPHAARSYRHLTPAGLSELAIRPDGGQVALAGAEGRVSLIVPETGALERELILGDKVTKCLAYAPRGGQLVVGLMSEPPLVLVEPDGTWRAFSVPRTARRLAWMPGGGLAALDMVRGLNRWSDPDAERIASDQQLVFVDLEATDADPVALDDQGWVWRVGATELGRRERRVGAMAVDARGEQLALVGDTTLWLSGREPIEVAGAGFRDVALSPDGLRVAAGGLDGHLRVWDTRTGALLLDGVGHSERVAALEFTPDGRWVVTASWDHSARFWDLGVLEASADELIATVEQSWGPWQEDL